MLRTFLGALVSVLLLAACAGPPSATSSGGNAEPLRFGVTPDYEPLVFHRDGELAGVEVDLARAVGSALERPVGFVELPWDDLIPALKDGRIDVIASGMSITPERSAQLAFTRSYLQVGQMALVRISDIGRFYTASALPNLRGPVGFEQNTTGQTYVLEQMSGATPIPFPDVQAGIDALRAGRIDAFIHDAPTVWRVAGRVGESQLMGLFRPLTEEHLAWAMRQDDGDWLAAIDAVLAEMRRNGRLQLLLDRWISLRIEVQ